MKITHVLPNNDELGKISKEQRAGHWNARQTSLLNSNFADCANLCGGLGIRVTEPSQLSGALRRGLAHDGPSLIEVMTDPELV